MKEIIRAAKCSIFFLDQDQRVTFRDIGEREEIRRRAAEAAAKLTELKLESQFRCNGSDGYLAWLNNTLQIEKTANPTLAGIDYDFRVFDSPNDLRARVVELNNESNKARTLALLSVLTSLSVTARSLQIPANALQDSSIRGYKSMLRENPEEARKLGDRIIKNTYRTLMTRGQKGCYVFCVDRETNQYFKRFFGYRDELPTDTRWPEAAEPEPVRS